MSRNLRIHLAHTRVRLPHYHERKVPPHLERGTTPKGPRAPLKSNTMANLKSPGKSPGKASSLAGKRTRDRAGGMSSIKARGNPREMEGAQRRAELRAKQERLGEERELREMLG